MVISISGCDGAGKSTQAELLGKKIATEHKLKITSIFDVIESDTYGSTNVFDEAFHKLLEFDVIVSRFYLKSRKFKEMQEKLVMSDNDVFNNKEMVKKVATCAKQEAELWFEKVIDKLLNSNKIIIFDRYYYDEIAYRALYNVPMQFVENLYQDFYVPNKAFYLRLLNSDEILSRNSLRKDINTTLFKNDCKIEELLYNFQVVSDKNNMSVIDSGRSSKEDIAARIYEEVMSIM